MWNLNNQFWKKGRHDKRCLSCIMPNYFSQMLLVSVNLFTICFDWLPLKWTSYYSRNVIEVWITRINKKPCICPYREILERLKKWQKRRFIQLDRHDFRNVLTEIQHVFQHIISLTRNSPLQNSAHRAHFLHIFAHFSKKSNLSAHFYL